DAVRYLCDPYHWFRGLNMRQSRLLVLAMVAVAVALFAAPQAQAHDLKAKVEVRAEVIYVEAGYDDESPAQEAKVTLTDAAGNEIARGKTDDRGVWTYPRPAPGTYTLVVTEVGHRFKTEIVVPETGTAEYLPS